MLKEIERATLKIIQAIQLRYPEYFRTTLE